jgi:hypothetical protein
MPTNIVDGGPDSTKADLLAPESAFWAQLSPTRTVSPNARPRWDLPLAPNAGWRRLGFCAQSLSMTGRWLSDLASEGDLRIQAVVLEELGYAGSCGVEHVVVESVVHQ